MIKQIISCFLEDIDPIFKISKNCLDGSPGSFGTYLFETFIFATISRLPKIINENESGLFLICLRCPSVSTDKYYWFWGLEPRPQIEKLRK